MIERAYTIPAPRTQEYLLLTADNGEEMVQAIRDYWTNLLGENVPDYYSAEWDPDTETLTVVSYAMQQRSGHPGQYLQLDGQGVGFLDDVTGGGTRQVVPGPTVKYEVVSDA